MYTYGQPRTGDQIYAQFVNSEFGLNAFRGESLLKLYNIDSQYDLSELSKSGPHK